MYIDDYLKNWYKWRKKSLTFVPSYKYWVNTLLEYPMRLFNYKGLPETIPQQEVDVISFFRGYVPIVKLSNGSWIAAVESSLEGVTDYYDVFKNVTFSTPLHFGKREIDKNAFIIRNTSLKNPLMPKVERYAALMAHAEISLVAEMVNLREMDFIEAMTENAARSAEIQSEARYNGETKILVNEGFAMLRHNFVPSKSQGENSKIWDLRSNILAAYLEEIGIKKSNDKRERQIVSEVSADDPMLKLNISDMLEVRQKDWDKFNKATGYNVKVTCNIDYSEEGNEVDLPNSPEEGGEDDGKKTV